MRKNTQNRWSILYLVSIRENWKYDSIFYSYAKYLKKSIYRNA